MQALADYSWVLRGILKYRKYAYKFIKYIIVNGEKYFIVAWTLVWESTSYEWWSCEVDHQLVERCKSGKAGRKGGVGMSWCVIFLNSWKKESPVFQLKAILKETMWFGRRLPKINWPTKVLIGHWADKINFSDGIRWSGVKFSRRIVS